MSWQKRGHLLGNAPPLPPRRHHRMRCGARCGGGGRAGLKLVCFAMALALQILRSSAEKKGFILLPQFFPCPNTAVNSPGGFWPIKSPSLRLAAVIRGSFWVLLSPSPVAFSCRLLLSPSHVASCACLGEEMSRDVPP